MIIMVSSLVMAADQAGEHTAATSFHREREERGSVSNETSASWWHSINTGQRGVTASISARNSTLRSQFKFTSSDHFLSIKFYDVLCRLAVILQSFSSRLQYYNLTLWLVVRPRQGVPSPTVQIIALEYRENIIIILTRSWACWSGRVVPAWAKHYTKNLYLYNLSITDNNTGVTLWYKWGQSVKICILSQPTTGRLWDWELWGQISRSALGQIRTYVSKLKIISSLE